MRSVSPTLPLETERLLLRAFTPEDFDALFAIYSRPDVVRWLYHETRSGREVGELLEDKARSRDIAKEGDKIVLAVVLKGTNEVIGDVVLSCASERHLQGEIGSPSTRTTTATGTRPRRRRSCSGWPSRTSGCIACMGGRSRGTRPRLG